MRKISITDEDYEFLEDMLGPDIKSVEEALVGCLDIVQKMWPKTSAMCVKRGNALKRILKVCEECQARMPENRLLFEDFRQWAQEGLK